MAAMTSTSPEQLLDMALTWGVNIFGAVVLLVAGWFAADWAGRSVRRLIAHSDHIDATLKPLLGSLVRYAVLLFVITAALAQFGVQTTSIIAVVGAAGLAVGLALQGTLANIAAGVMLLFLRPLEVGDYIESDGVAGTVDEIGVFTTQLHTFDGIYVTVPNSQLWNKTIRNYSRLPTRRLDVAMSVGYADDLERAMGVLHGLLDEDRRVLREPAPQVLVTALNGGFTVTMRCWTESGNFGDLQSDLLRLGRLRLSDAGLSTPYSLRAVREAPVLRPPSASS
ncbi:MAG: mechanosensitive ion channel [Rhodospirillales bacterium]|nr:mechanosensitive ion channel [Rhodospirillales bacterium]